MTDAVGTRPRKEPVVLLGHGCVFHFGVPPKWLRFSWWFPSSEQQVFASQRKPHPVAFKTYKSVCVLLFLEKKKATATPLIKASIFGLPPGSIARLALPLYFCGGGGNNKTRHRLGWVLPHGGGNQNRL